MRIATMLKTFTRHQPADETPNVTTPVDHLLSGLQAQTRDHAAGRSVAAVPRGDPLIELADGRVLTAAVDPRTGAVFGVETLVLVEIAGRADDSQRVIMSPSGSLLDANELINNMHVEGIALGGGLCRFPPPTPAVPYVVLRPSADATEDSTMAFEKLCTSHGPFGASDVIEHLFSNYQVAMVGADDKSAVGLIWVQGDHVWMIEHDGHIDGLLGSNFVPIPAWQAALADFLAAESAKAEPDQRGPTEHIIVGLNHGDRVYWSNAYGWTGAREEADHFNSTDYNLPVGENVRWVPTDGGD